ncbi:Glycosyltransferase involved in cell wall bisynthesis [Flavobacterium sp. CF108]|uniref:glycosyltransferase family 4 protein n=1 Tax=unclassified Flavobacterium TaxID=196869 RepID=UPI0008C3CEED|nr:MULTISPECIES: glycosyltransferase family 4 protein [unclassified Flavobacterium]SEO77728.1 Glycosyltransferase involved in cell wall bisynthesis [Flavobacterium sp. fv08]SHG78165.1 Glycosyltransferase involved in cell wall bisynthesis [Flavobacterium sp. CF108]
MKLLYIVPNIKNAGGVARVLSIKANYFIEHFGYEVHILSQNEDENSPFYDFNSKIIFHNMILEGNVFHFLNSYKKHLNQKIAAIKPDVILVADNGLKAFILPLIVKTKIPIVLEIHSSKFIEEQSLKSNIFSKLKYKFKDFGAEKYTKVVVLSSENLKDWPINNAVIIPNPSWIKTENAAALKNKRVIAVARNSYEKGLDRMLLIWEKVIDIHPDWTLDIYTDEVDLLNSIVIDLGLTSTISVFSFVKNIEEKYLESSILVMTSRFEAFPMVLIEAMSLGLPSISYDCPSGPRSIITDNENGFLIPDGDLELFAEKLSFLIENEELRIKFGAASKEKMKEYQLEPVMKQWKALLENF